MAESNRVSRSDQSGADQKVPSFPVAMIHSRESLGMLENELNRYGDFGPLRIVYGRDEEGNLKELNLSIAVIPDATYNALCRDGYEHRRQGHCFTISRFELKDNNYPREGQTRTLFVPVPKEFACDEVLVSNVVRDKMEELAHWGIVPPSSWSITIPSRSRELGGVKGGCFISFPRELSIHHLAMTRVLLTDTYWPEIDPEMDRLMFRCMWARARKERTREVVPVEADPVKRAEVKKAAKKASVERTVSKVKPAASLEPPKKAPAKGKGKGQPKADSVKPPAKPPAKEKAKPKPKAKAPKPSLDLEEEDDQPRMASASV